MAGSDDKTDDADQEDQPISIITTAIGEIKGKGLVPIGSKHTIHPSAFSDSWMIHDTVTADGIMEIDPIHRYKVDLTALKPEELKLLFAQVVKTTSKKKMKREDMERMITERLVEIAESDKDKE